MKTDGNRPTPSGGSGFTLVELLAVVGIIVILAGLLIPSLMAARNAAKEAACQSLIQMLSSGLDMYKTESLFGRTYPPSFMVSNYGDPYSVGQHPSPDNTSFFGAQTLVWALVGADMLGTPGFSVSLPTITLSNDPTVDTNEDGIPDGLYALKSDGKPWWTRRGPYIDTTKVQIASPSNIGYSSMQQKIQGSYQGSNFPPVFVDVFNNPILYYMANPGGNNLWNYYRYRDNIGFTGPYDGIPYNHPINLYMQPIPPSNPNNYPNFHRYIEDQRVKSLVGDTTGAWQPQNRDSYLLISPGIDHRFGTGDDITNFNPNSIPQN